MERASRICQEASWPDRVVRRGPSATSKLLLRGAEFKRSNVKERQLPLADVPEDSRDSSPAGVQPRTRIC